MTQPAQKAQFLCFIFNSVDITVSMVPSKADKVVAACNQLLSATKPTVHNAALIVGELVACYIWAFIL